MLHKKNESIANNKTHGNTANNKNNESIANARLSCTAAIVLAIRIVVTGAEPTETALRTLKAILWNVCLAVNDRTETIHNLELVRVERHHGTSTNKRNDKQTTTLFVNKIN